MAQRIGQDPLAQRESWRPSPVARRESLAGAALGVMFLAAWSASTVLLRGSSDLDLFFWSAAQTAAHGHPQLIYSTHTPGVDPFANGPLGLVPLTGVAWLANAGHWADNIPVRTFVTTAVFSVFVWLMATRGFAAIERGRGVVQWRLAAIAVFLLAPTLWISVADFGHFEQPLELWLVLLAVGAVIGKRPAAAGIAMGLALLTRTTALLYLLPLAFLAVERYQHRLRVGYLGITFLTAAAGIAPFAVADGPGVLHSLITYRAVEPIGGASFWALPFGAWWQAFAMHADTYLAIALGLIVCGVISFRRGGLPPTWANAAGLLTVAAACFPLLARTAFPYYFLEPYVFGVVWWLARPGSAANWRVTVPILITGDALLTKWGDVTPFTTIGVTNSVISSAVMLAVVGLVAVDLVRTRAAEPVRNGEVGLACRHPKESVHAASQA